MSRMMIEVTLDEGVTDGCSSDNLEELDGDTCISQLKELTIENSRGRRRHGEGKISLYKTILLFSIRHYLSQPPLVVPWVALGSIRHR